MASRSAKDYRSNQNNSTLATRSAKYSRITEEDLNAFYESFQGRLDNWTKARDELYNSAKDYYNNRDLSTYGLDSSKGWKDTVSSKHDWLKSEADYLNSILDEYGSYFDSEAKSQLKLAFADTLTSTKGIQKQAIEDISYWNNFKDENQYLDYYYGSKYSDMSYSDVMKARESATGKEKDWLMQNYMTSAEAQAEIDRLEATLPSYFEGWFDKIAGKDDEHKETRDRIAQLKGIRDTAERTEKVESYEPYRSDSRFAEASSNGASITNPTVEEINEYEYLLEKAYSSIDRTSPDGGMVAEAEVARLEQNPVKVQNKVHFYLDNPELRGYPVHAGATDEDWESIMHRGLQYNWDELTEDEIQMYDYLLAEKGEEVADQYLEDIQVVLDQRATEAMNAHVKSQIENTSGFKGFLVNTGLSLASIPTNVFGGALAFADNTISQLKGESINPYSPAQSFRNFSTTVRGEVGAEIADKATWELFGQNVMQNVYNAGLSMGDSLLGAFTIGKAYTLVAGSGAAASHAADLYEKGASNEQIFWGGVTAGVAEAVFEKLSIDRLLSGKVVESPLQFVTEVLKQAGVEGSEEVFTEIANIISDSIVMGSQSDLSLAIKMYEDGYFDENGIHHEPLSHADAVKKALTDKVCEVAWAGISGMLSGGGSSFIVTGAQYSQQANAQTDLGRDIIKNNGYDALKGLATDASSVGLVKGEANIKNLAQKTQTGVDAIKEGNASKRQANKTFRQVGRLSQNVDSVRNEQNIAEIQASLESKGLSKSKARKAALLLNEALYSDGAYSKELYKSVMNDEGVWDTLRELVSSPDSSLKNRNLQHKLGRMGLKVGENGTIVSSVKAGEAESHYVDESLSFIEDASKREYEASVDGKSIDTTTGKTIDIVEVASIKDGKMMLKVKGADGAESVVNAKDVSYASESEALVYEAVANMGLNAVSANSILKLYNPSQNASTFARGVQEAYRYGLYNYSEFEMYQEGNFLLDLTDAQVERAYKLGQIQSGSDTAVAVAKLKEAIANSNGKKGEGRVHFEGDAVGIDVDGLKDQQKVSIKTMEMLSKALGIEFYVYASYENENGDRVYKDEDGVVKPAPNGIYDKATGAIHIDLNAGETGEGTMLFTIAHELTHFIKAWSPAKFKVLANFLVEQYGKKGMSVEQLVRRQMANMKANGRKNVTYDKAFEEFVADSMETMLTSGNVVETLAEIKRVDEGLWNKIKEFFSNLVEHLKEVVSTYSEFAPNTIEGQTVAEMTDVIEKLEKLFTEALVDASENFRAISSTEQQTLAEVGIGFDEDTRSVHSLRFSTGRKDALGNVIDLVKVGKKEFNTESIAQLVAKGTGRSIEDARKWVNSEIAIANIVMNHPEFLDFQADDRYESIKKNSDYPQGTVDLSNLCPKRTEFTAMFDMLQKKYPNKLFTASDVAAMRSILKKRGITVACGACFVEDRRQLLGEIADTYIGMWKEAVETGKPLQKTNASGNKVTLTVTSALAKQYGLTKGSEILATDKYIPTQYDLTTYEGFKLLEKNHPTIAMGFNRYNNSRGQQAGRLIEGRAEYNRQILGWSPEKVKSVNNNGGLRIFSFSDFEVVHLLDLVQVILDCSAMGVKIQGYTKIPSFARLIRDTGIKINRSLIPKGQTGLKKVNGKWVLDYDTTEGIDINDENFIDERDNPNVGNILIGINPTQIGIAMLDDFVDYIIPFHTNKSKDICKALGLAEWVNYKESQHEKDIDTGKASKHNVNIYTEVIGKYHPTNKVEFVNAFLKVCKAQKKIPRYSEFLNKEYKADGAYTDEYGSFDFTYREGYHKLLVDFKMFDHDGNILPQGEITPNLDDGFMAKLLKAEVDKKKSYEFPQEVYDQLDKEFGESATDNSMLSDRNKKLTDADLDEYMQVGKKLRTRNNKRRLLDSGKKPILTSTEEVSSFMSDVVCGKALGEVRAFAKVGTRLANAVLDVDGSLDVLGDYLELPADDLRESYKRHSLPKEKGDIPLRASDFERIPEYLDDFDGVLFTNYYHEKKEIHLYKETDEGYVRILAVSSNERGSLLVTKLIGVSKEKFEAKYAKKMERNIGSPRGQSEKSDASNPPTGARLTADVLSKDRIAQNPDSVNTSEENSYSDRILMGSLFSGGGTLEAGLVYQMLDKEFAVEVMPGLAATYTDNHGKEHMFVGDVRDFDSKGKRNVFYLHASPVCKNFSPASNKGGETELDIVTAEATARILEEQMPQVFTVENVKRYIGSEAYNIIVNKLTELGYKWDVDVYKASDYGNATKRERMIVRAVKDGEPPAKPAKATNITSWGEATRDLWETDLTPSYLVKSKIEAIRNTPQLKNLRLTKLDKPLLIYDTNKRKQVSYAWADELAPTLTTKCGDARIIMPDGKVYAPTPKFMGRIQGLPDNYKYPKATTNAFKIIGNGIPTQLTKAVMGGVLDSAYQQTHDGEMLYSDRNKTSVSNRTLLANALESVAQNDVERSWLAKYKSQIESLNADQNELSKIRAKIKEARFTQGADRSQLPALENKAKILAERINRADKKLLNLEASKPLKGVLDRERAKAYAEARQKGKEELQAYREAQTAKYDKLREDYKESRHKAVEGRHKTALRNDIKRVAKELAKVLNDNARDRNVKIDLQPLVRKAIELADILYISNASIVESGVENTSQREAEALARYRDLLAQYEQTEENVTENKELRKELREQMHELDKQLSDLFERERIRLNNTKASSVVDELKTAYEALKNSKDEFIKNAYVEGLKERLEQLSKELTDVTLKDLNEAQLKNIYKMFAAVKHMVSTSNKLFREGRAEDLQAMVNSVLSELGAIESSEKDLPQHLDKALGVLRSFTWNELRPVDAFERLGSEAFTKLFWDTVYAQDTYARDVVEAGKKIETVRKAHGYSKWDMKTAKTFKSFDGLDFKLTLADIMSIYAYLKREQAYLHMTDGGFVFDTGSTYKDGKTEKVHKKLTRTYRMSDDTLMKIVATLTAEQKAYVDEIQSYLTEIGKKGNEVSRILFGIDLFNEEFYFPLQSETDYRSSTEQALNATQTMVSLKNTGVSKATTPGANNPIVLRGFDDVVLEHIDTMSKYHAYVVPIENIQRVFNNVGRASDDSFVSTQAYIESKFGKEAKAYFDQWIKDLNGGAHNASGAIGLFSKLFATGKAMAVSTNLSVVLQQYFAIVRAMEEVDAKYFIPFINGKASKPDGNVWEELKKYAPVAVIKEMGGFDVGSKRSAKDYIGWSETKMSASKFRKNINDIGMLGASKMDELGWSTIWLAIKKEVASTQNLIPGTEEFLKACGKRFTEVVTKTQVYDSVVSRSGYMRSKNDFVKAATSFMGEPTVVVGNAYITAIKLARAKKSKDKSAIKSASKKAVRVATALVVSSVLGNLAKALAYAGRDDDEDEAFLERWAKHFGTQMASDGNPLNYLPFGRDIVSIWEGWDVERPDVTLLADVITSIKKAVDDGTTFEEALALIGNAGNLLGIPLKNLIREVESAVRFIGDIVDDTHPTDIGGAFVRGLKGEERSKTDAIYDHIINGDKGKLEEIKKTYKTESAYETAIRKALRENDSRINEAAKARMSGDIEEYTRIVREIVSEGHFSQDLIVGAVNNAITALKKEEEANNPAPEEEDEYVTITSIYNGDDLNYALDSGDTDTATAIIDDLLRVKTENYLAKARKEAEKDGKSFNERTALKEAESKAKSSVKSSITSYWKPLYKEAYKKGDTEEMKRIRYMLRDTKLYGSTSDVLDTVKGWLKS